VHFDIVFKLLQGPIIGPTIRPILVSVVLTKASSIVSAGLQLSRDKYTRTKRQLCSLVPHHSHTRIDQDSALPLRYSLSLLLSSINMPSQKLSCEDTLNAYLYSTDDVVDRLVRVQGHDLRSSHVSTAASARSSQKPKDNGVGAAVRRLERAMDKITDRVLLADARTYQQGM
jgi:hypothetical protein